MNDTFFVEGNAPSLPKERHLQRGGNDGALPFNKRVCLPRRKNTSF